MSDERESRDKRPRPRYAAADDGNRRSSDRPSSRDRSGTGPERGSDRSDSPRADRERSSRAPGGKRYGDKPYGDKRSSSGRRSGEQKPYGQKKPYAGRRSDDRPGSDRRAASGKPYGADRSSDRSYGDERGSGRPPYGEKRGAGSGRKGEYRGDKPYGDRRESGAHRDGRPGGRPQRTDQRRDNRFGAPGGRPPRAGARDDRSRDQMRESEERAARHPAPPIPDDVTPRDLNPAARNELKTLSKENAEKVARHLAMAAALIDDDPALAHEHALAAVRSAGRIAVVRETAAITAYSIGDYALALRELRTFRRISGRDDQIALMVDSERGVGRPDRALELGRSVDRSTLPPAVRVELAIAMSGARLDLGQTERALLELDIPELDPDRAYEWSPALFSARAAVLEELGRSEEAEEWQRRAVVAAEAIDDASGLADSETIFIEEIEEEVEEPQPGTTVETEPAEASEAAESGPTADAPTEASAPGEAPADNDTDTAAETE